MIDTTDFIHTHDGFTMTGQIAKPSGDGPHPGALVMHSALGLDDLVCRRVVNLSVTQRISWVGNC
jgi:dienelactone hydrolase